MEIYSWCIMTNYVHLVFRSIGEERPEILLGKFKRFTSNAIVKAIKENERESRKNLQSVFRKIGPKTSNVTHNQFRRRVVSILKNHYLLLLLSLLFFCDFPCGSLPPPPRPLCCGFFFAATGS